MQRKKVQITVRLDPQLVEQIDDLRARVHASLSRNAVIVHAIQSFIEQPEPDTAWRWFLNKF